jgi:formate hydrogenlyase subunit 3/multisubunit Na+/H+ antiporter MnhD subunit
MEQMINYFLNINHFIAGLIVIFSGGLLALLMPDKVKAQIFCIFTGIGAILILYPVINILAGINDKYEFVHPLGKIAFLIDPLSAFFTLIIIIVSFISTIYSIGYLKQYLNKNNNIGVHLFFLCILIISMLLVAISQNMLFFLIVWELMSLSSFFLVYFENNDKEVVRASINYLIYMHIGFVLLLTGFILTSIKTSFINFNDFKGSLNGFIFILFFIGFGIKAGMIPFHTWLPKAHASAPSHVSAIMSAVMIKTGIYGILRIISIMDSIQVWIAYLVLVTGLVSAVLGILFSLRENDIKKILAYSSVENIGIILSGIGVGLMGLSYSNKIVIFIGFAGAVLHTLNHSVFKSMLFYSAGNVYLVTHKRNIELFGGLSKKMPALTFLTFIGVMAISAIPPFNGFISKFIIYFGLLKLALIDKPMLLFISIISVALLAFVGGLCLFSFTRLMSITFLGQPRSKSAIEAKKPSFILILPMIIMAIAIIAIGLLPGYTLFLLQKPVSLFTNNVFILESTAGLLKKISFVFYILIGTFSLIFFLRFILTYKKISTRTTWGCGYKKLSPKIQYTADSFTKGYAGFLKIFFKQKSKDILHETLELFPKQHELKNKPMDKIEYYIIKPLSKLILKMSDLFSWIQSGNMQQYILYGLLFLVVAVIFAVYF